MSAKVIFRFLNNFVYKNGINRNSEAWNNEKGWKIKPASLFVEKLKKPTIILWIQEKPEYRNSVLYFTNYNGIIVICLVGFNSGF